MKVVVFAGPSLSRNKIHSVLNQAEVRPPAGRGDVYEAVTDGAPAIALIDGYFGQQPSVCHKELLWALATGVRVYGAASMGALRAAELHAYGMVGVGSVFEAFLKGDLEDDDEVALVHGAADREYVSYSDSMVDIRATLSAAQEQGVISRNTASRLLAVAKAMHYPDRSLRALATHRLVGPGEFERFYQWLPMNRVRLKESDAVQLLLRIKAEMVAGIFDRGVTSFEFEETLHWRRLTEDVIVRRNPR